MRRFWTVVAAAVCICSAAWAGKDAATVPADAGSPEFRRIKALAGRWQGVTKHEGGKEEPVTVEYKVTSGGTAVVETLTPGTPHEMVSVYYDREGRLGMTHYCMVGNQPEMVLKSSDAHAIALESTVSTQAQLQGDMYMNALTLRQPDKDHLTQEWHSIGPDGKPLGQSVFTLKKV